MFFFLCVYVLFSAGCCFFKQKTAYEMRISDWSSDVCSSDLILATEATALCRGREAAELAAETARKAFEEGSFGGYLPVLRIARDRLDAGIERSEERRVGNEGASTYRSR